MFRHMVWGPVVRMGSVLLVLDLVPVGLVLVLVPLGLGQVAPDLNLAATVDRHFLVLTWRRS